MWRTHTFFNPILHPWSDLNPSPLRTLRTSVRQCFIDTLPRFVYNLCMMPVMVKEADLDRIEVPEGYEILDATTLGKRHAVG